MRIAKAIVLLFGMLSPLAAAGDHLVRASVEKAHSVWAEAKWPFLMDQWGLGRAFACQAADCGHELTLYLRPKVGFCNCTTGVTEDEEIDRVGDMNLLGNWMHAQGAGAPVEVAWMKGRSRVFMVGNPYDAPRYVLTVVLSNKCDAIVATLVSNRELGPESERAALEFLRSETVLTWAGATTGL